MKNFKQRLIAAAAFACVAAVSLTGCSDGSSSKKNDVISDDVIEIITNASGDWVASPFQVIDPDDGSVSLPNGLEINAPDPVKEEVTTGVVTVTDAKGEPATEYVAVTDDKGEPATELITETKENGEEVTKAVTVTEAVPVTEVVTGATKPEEYQSKTTSKYIFWLDIEKDIDYNFNGQFVKISFKVKDDAPDGDYTITIDPDISTVGGVSLNKSIKKFNGTVRVGGSIDPADVSEVDGPVIYADKVSAKQGDTIDYYINFDKNPGCAAMMIWFSYDENAIECVSSPKPFGEFAEVAAARAQSGSLAN